MCEKCTQRLVKNTHNLLLKSPRKRNLQVSLFFKILVTISEPTTFLDLDDDDDG